MTIKPKRTLMRAVALSESGIKSAAGYRVRNLPGAGAVIKPGDREEQQISLMDE